MLGHDGNGGTEEGRTLLRSRHVLDIRGRKAGIIVLFTRCLPSVGEVIALQERPSKLSHSGPLERQPQSAYLLRQGLVVLDIDGKIASRSVKPLAHAKTGISRPATRGNLTKQIPHLVPLDLIQLLDQLLAVLSLAEKLIQMRAPFLGRDDVAGEFLDVGLDVRPEDVEAADLAFDVQEKVASPIYPSTALAMTRSRGGGGHTYLSYGTVLNPTMREMTSAHVERRSKVKGNAHHHPDPRTSHSRSRASDTWAASRRAPRAAVSVLLGARGNHQSSFCLTRQWRKGPTDNV